MKRNQNLMAIAILALAAFSFVASSSRTMSQGTPGYNATTPFEGKFSNEFAIGSPEVGLDAPFRTMDASLAIDRVEDRTPPAF